MGKRIVQTPRVVVREFTAADAEFVLELLNTEGWLQYIGDRNIRNTSDAKKYIREVPLHQYKNHGFGIWVMELIHTKKPIGLIGFLQRINLDMPDIGYALLPQYYKQGYTGETMDALLQIAPEKWKITGLYAITSPKNEASHRVLNRFKFQLIGTYPFPQKEEISWLWKRDL